MLKGLKFENVFSKKNQHPYDELEWEKRDAVITEADGTVIFEQKDVEVPKNWSQLATNIVASKYFKRGGVPDIERETSVKQLIDRIVFSIVESGSNQGGYFVNDNYKKVFEKELTAILVNQYASFNSPVQFNSGLWHKYGMKGNAEGYFYNLESDSVKESDNCYRHPQNSACFIQSVDDTIDSMIELQRSEIKLFKYGSGTGTNFSKIRSKGEPLSGGGTSSGVLSFLEGYDTWAGCIKSGGTTRRSAKMVVLDIDHPEIMDFIHWKVNEEEKAKALIDAGYEHDFNGEAYRTVSGQNSNNSVRIPDDFMEAYEKGQMWSTVTRVDKKVEWAYESEDIMDCIAEAAWRCADPGVQFSTTINKWHTCSSTGPINASNPCSEFLFLDDTACNLASINLVKFLDDEGKFDVDGYLHCVKVLITAMDIIVDMSSYPTEKIAKNSHFFRPLGLGYANLGSLLMRLGYAYDSEEGRGIAAYLTSLLSAYGYVVSANIANSKGCFTGYTHNKSSMQKVMNLHLEAAQNLKTPKKELFKSASNLTPVDLWKQGIDRAKSMGYRNSQISVIAPTGTIAFMMDCDTTGIEPDFSLIKFKTLAGGGSLMIVNQSIRSALKNLRHSDSEIEEILDFILKNGTVQNAPYLNPANYPIFDCAVAPLEKHRVIDYMGHVRMLAAVQPFVSGGISKTVNLPKDVTADDIKELYVQAWKMGVKCLAVYRDGCKDSQPLNVEETKMEKVKDKISVKPTIEEREGIGECESLGGSLESEPENLLEAQPQRNKLPTTRKAIAHRFSVNGHKGYLHVGLFGDGRPGEIFIRMNKEGSCLSGLLDAFATSVSLNLQYGVPLVDLVNKFKGMNFEPHGFTESADIPRASSIIDYIFQYLEKEFVDGQT